MTENKYANGKIYAIVDNTTGARYIGSTTQALQLRLIHHKSDFKLYRDGKYHYVTSFQILKNGDYRIVLLEEVRCTTRKELESRERHHIESNDCINKIVPCRTDNEYYQANRERILEQKREYHEANRERINKYKREYNTRKRQQKASIVDSLGPEQVSKVTK